MTTKSTLLQPKELTICQGLAKRSDLHGRRAQALLALNGGDSQTDAGVASGLSAGQVKYALYQFRQRRLEIFPAELLNSAKTAPPKDGAISPSTGSTSEPAVTDEPIEPLSPEKGKTKPPKKTSGGKKKKKKKKTVATSAGTKKKKKKKKALKAEKEGKSAKKKKKKKKKK